VGSGYVSKFSVDLANLQELFDEAKRLTNHTEFVVIGSLSILGVVDGAKIPPRMLMSIDVDCYTRQDPSRIFDLRRPLGEASDFQANHGYYLDPVAPTVATLPDGWESRFVLFNLGRDGGVLHEGARMRSIGGSIGIRLVVVGHRNGQRERSRGDQTCHD
jgi:hypothetical protein